MRQQLLIGGAMIAATALLVFVAQARAGTDDTDNRFTGLVCKSPEALQSVFEVHDANPEDPIQSNVAAVNGKVADSCNIKSVVTKSDKGIVLSFHAAGMDVDVHRFEIYAECSDGFCVYAKFDDQYIGVAGKPSI
jgi:hypothetical protein